MGRRGTRSALALCMAALTASLLAGCADAANRPSSAGQHLVQQVQLDRNGNPVEPVADPNPVDPAGDGTAVCPPLSIAMAGPLSGPASTLGANVNNGMQLAVDKHNQANRGCQIQLKTFDTHGDPTGAGTIAQTIRDDAFTIGLVGGPTSTGETMAANEVFDRPGMVAPTAGLSAFHPGASFHGVASDAVEGAAVARYMAKTLGYQKVCVVVDDAEGSTELTLAVRGGLGPLADGSCSVAVTAAEEGFANALTRIEAARPDAVYFGGSDGLAARFVDQLRAKGSTATFVTAGRNADFVGQAGAAAKDAIVSCGCSPAPESFVTEYSARFNGEQPGPFAAEAYDLATIMLTGIDSGAITRPAMVDFMRGYDGQGVARRYRWTPDGELVDPLIWIYEVQ
jgi:branched-chain amino acid transport system substrate-binding protein